MIQATLYNSANKYHLDSAYIENYGSDFSYYASMKYHYTENNLDSIVHCTNEKYIHQDGRMPWLFGETAEEVAHTYLDMRYRLLPLYYYLARENYDTGLPIMKRLDIEYPEYVEASRNDEYLLGDYILVAPISEGVVDVKVPNESLSHTQNGQKVTGLKAEYFNNNSSYLEHEATVSKIEEDKLFYLMSRGIDEDKAKELIILGFVNAFREELPMEYAVELNRLLSTTIGGV